MMQNAPPDRPGNATGNAKTKANARLVVPLVIVFAVAMPVLGAIMAFSLRDLVFPPGEAIASLDLRAPTAETAVDLAAGDKLIFRADVAALGGGLKTSLRRVRLTAGLRPPAGPARSTSCAIYNGGAKSSSSGLTKSRLTGTSNDCELVADTAGRYTLRVQAAWGTLSPTEARLEIRRVPAK